MPPILSFLENIDEMLLQFQGREGELVTTLRTMKDQQNGAGEYEGADDDSAYRSLFTASDGRKDSTVSIFESDASGTSDVRRASSLSNSMSSSYSSMDLSAGGGT